MRFDPAFPFDAGQVDRIPRQAATIQIIALNSRLEWKQVDNNVLDSLYKVMGVIEPGIVGPGNVQSSFAKGAPLRQQIETQAEKLWAAFHKEWKTSAEAGTTFIDLQTKHMRRSVHELDRLRLQARQVNEEVDQLLQKALFWLNTTKFTAEIALNILGLIPGGGLLGFVVRTGVGLSYPVGVELIQNWEKANISKLSLLAFLGAVQTNISSILTEDTTMGHAELKLVKEPMQQARAEAAFQKGLKKLGGGSSRAVKGARANIGAVKTTTTGNAFGLGTAAKALTGVSCYFAVTGSIQSGEAYQEALQSL